MKPDALIIGVQRGGTSSLYNYLIQHPDIDAASRKEILFFDQNYSKGNSWYQQQFKEKFSIEASPDYYYHHSVPERIYDHNPNIKIILLLRNPTERAFSHYLKNKCGILGYHRRMDTFINFFYSEINQLIVKNESMNNPNYSRSGFFGKGIYIYYLYKWLETFGSNNLLVIKSEEFREHKDKIYNDILKFLGLPPHSLKEYKEYSGIGKDIRHKQVIQNMNAIYTQPDKEDFKVINQFYARYNIELVSKLGVDITW